MKLKLIKIFFPLKLSPTVKKHLLMSIPDLFPENEGKNAEDFKIMHEQQKLLTDQNWSIDKKIQ